ncbi:MAG TPA: HEAT repeat domain-containing protein [Caulobacteraceae bacterium]|nr:HEAT repeat domain-containing protein [Caulobacteraceae bacterium]
MIAVVDENQLDLFSTAATPPRWQPPAMAAPPTPPGHLDDDALVAALPLAGMLEAVALAREVGRRGVGAAVPALQVILRRHAGFGARGPAVAEQAAALDALVAIGGPAATQAVSRAIVRGEVQGATLAVAMSAGARLGASFPPDRLADLLGHDDPAIRADACRCARPHATVLALLVELLGDLDPAVHRAAACALGRMGRAEALPVLVRLLATSPSVEVVEALAQIADDDVVVLLGRTARSSPDLRQPIVEALEGRDDPLALKVVEGLRRERA